MNNINQLKKNLTEDLELCDDEAEIFLAIVKSEKTTSDKYKINPNYTKEKAVEICKNLEQKGMIIEINKNEFQVLHPRFAIVNRYRRICKEKNVKFKKNIKIDNIGIMLEKYQNENS